jgi:hypothetical protein
MYRIVFALFLFYCVLFYTTTAFSAIQNVQQGQQPDSVWDKELISKLHLTQSNYDNWTTGAENSFSWQVKVLTHLRKDWTIWGWSNEGKFSYGKTKVGKQEARKSLDEIKLESVLSYKLGIKINPYVALNIETQSTAGYKYSNGDKLKISDFFDPAYLRQSIGFGYVKKPVFKTRVGFAVRETITRQYWQHSDDPKTQEIEKIYINMGLESVTDIQVNFNSQLVLKSKLQLFSGMNKANAVDVNWDNILSAKVAKYFDVDLNIKLIYDKDISMQRQLMQVLSLGFTYSFF